MKKWAWGFLCGLLVSLSLLWFLPQVYMGPAFGKADMTRAEVIKVMEQGKRIHAWYAKLPWRQQIFLAGGGERFDRYWIRTYEAAIGYLRTCPGTD